MRKTNYIPFLIVLLVTPFVSFSQTEKADDVRKLYPFDRITVMGNINCELI